MKRKPVCTCEFVEIHRAITGEYYITGTMLEDHHANPRMVAGTHFYSSRLVKVDLRRLRYETLNTIYQEMRHGQLPVRVWDA